MTTRKVYLSAPGRFAVRVLIAIFTAVVLLLLQPVFWSRVISVWMSVAVVGLILLSYFRPQSGLLVVAALAPIAGLWSPLVAVRVRGAEAVVLAFLAGVLLRGWTLHRFRHVVADRLQMSALAFGVIVAASCIGQLWVPGLDYRDFFEYLFEHYLTSFRGFSALFFAMLLLEGLAVLVCAAHYCRTQPALVPRLVRMLVIGAVAAAAFNWWFFVNELGETGQPAANFTEFLLKRRWSAHVGDVNAAGSFFAMTMIMAIGLALTQRPNRAAWAGAGLILSVALWMTASRAAITAVLLVGAVCLTRLALGRSVTRSKTTAIAAVALVALALFSAQYFLSWVTAPTALRIRWMFLETTWRMLQVHPLGGVGIGQYPSQSGRFSSPELLVFYLSENAHNNFAQIAGELGLVGLAAFVWVLVVSFSGLRRSDHRQAVIMPVFAGVAAFVVSWLGGHPLLVPAVAYPFWLALAVIAAAPSDIISAETHG